MAEKIIAGVEEAGRGAVIGSLVIVGLTIEESKEQEMMKLGVKDSKLLSPRRRAYLDKEIEKLAKEVVVLKIAACKIDDYRKKGINLNRLEGIKMADIINILKPEKTYVDCPDTNTGRFKAFLKSMLTLDCELVVEHKADVNYPVVSAASIVAKHSRDMEIEELKKKYGDFGPGYSSNPKTMDWLRAWKSVHKEFPDCVRKSWETSNSVKVEIEQSRLAKFISKIGKK